MKIPSIGLIIFNTIAIIYLAYPTPQIPNLPQSIISTEPGDTVQMSRVTGYFTNQDRASVIGFYSTRFHPLFSFRLNHPPEKSKQIFRDTMQSYYLEEIVVPFKGSLFINGYEWANDVFTKPENRQANKILVDGKEYKSKITIRYFFPTIAQRLFSFFVLETAAILFLYSLKHTFHHKH